MSRIQLTDSIPEVLTKLSEGNPGAVTVMIRLIQDGDGIDPDSWAGSLTPMLSLDSYRIYGSHIWILYKDICKQDIRCMCAVLRSVQLGMTSPERLKAEIRERSEGVEPRNPLDAREILKGVMEYLPAFNRPAIQEPVAS